MSEKRAKKQEQDPALAYDREILSFQQESLFKAMGYTREDVRRTRIAVVNSWSEQSPGHVHLREVAAAVKDGIRVAGGTPFEFNVLGPCSSFAGSIDDLVHYDLPQREVIANSIETGLHVGWCDGWVGLCTCDKIVPAMLIAALRMNRPCIIVCGGSMLPGEFEGDWVALGKGGGILAGKLVSGGLPDEAYDRLTSACGNCAGACAEMTTGNTMQIMAEALGMSLPHSSTAPAVMAEQRRLARRAGERIVGLAREGIRPRDIITRQSLHNAMVVDMAVCGGTNTILHLQAFAWEAGIPLDLGAWDEISRKTPVISAVAPSGPYSVVDLHKAGGVPALMAELKDLLNLDVPTVTGKTVAGNIANARSLNNKVIRPISDPVWAQGALAILRGNLAPRGAVVRQSIVQDRELLQGSYNAKVFDTYYDALRAILEGNPKRIEPGDAIVCRYQGPRGGPAMAENYFIVDTLRRQKIPRVIVLTDGRFSGFTRETVAIGHICPEAQVGGPLAALHDGDRIILDIPRRKLDVALPLEEIKTRLAAWRPPAPGITEGVLTLYARFAMQADQGGGWPTRWSEIKDL